MTSVPEAAVHASPGAGHTKTWPRVEGVNTWTELVEWFDLENPADHKDCGAFITGELADDPDTGRPRRLNSNVVSRSALLLDADYADDEFLGVVELALLGTAWCAWSTFSSRLVDADHDGRPRYR